MAMELYNISQLHNLTTKVVIAYIKGNSSEVTDISILIKKIYEAFSSLDYISNTKKMLIPAVPIGKSVFYDYIICLEDGQKRQLLKRYLWTVHGLTPDAYRRKWGLPDNYPMAAPAYAERRAAQTKKIQDRKRFSKDIISPKGNK